MGTSSDAKISFYGGIFFEVLMVIVGLFPVMQDSYPADSKQLTYLVQRHFFFPGYY